MKKLSVFLALIFGSLPVSASAEQTVTLPFNYLFNGDVLINSLTVGQCLQASTGGKIVSSGAACGGGGGGVTSVTGSGNILSSGGATPNITTVASPTFTGLTDSGLASGDCVQATTGGLLTSASAACGTGTLTSVTSTTALALTASTTGGAVSIAIPTSPTFGGNVTVGQLSSAGSVTGSILGGANLNVAGCAAVNNANQIIGTGVACASVANYQSGTLKAGLHIETGQLTASTSSPYNATLTFGAAYNVAPFCTATYFGAFNGSIAGNIVSESTTNVVITDSIQGAGDVFNVQCIGY
jgi:hypothetical protein